MAEEQQQSKERPVSEKRKKYVVAAIDFGTYYSGYAYSLKNDFKKDPTQHIVTNTWDTGKMLSDKAPTCVLFKEDGGFDSFGYEAEEKYGEIAIEGEEEVSKWFFFERFKMKLHNQKIHRETTLQDVNGKEMLAKTVFSASITFIKDHLLKEYERKQTTLNLEDIHWVLTVPVIWSDAGKQFMREAAIEAGLPSALLSIALEPEAVSLFCQYKHVKQDHRPVVVFEPPKIGTKYAVINLGGGTADITVHEKQADGTCTLREFTHASGGPLDEMYVNIGFENLLISIFGADIYTQFKKEFPAVALDMLREFELRKRSLKPSNEGKKITVCSVKDLLDLYKDNHNEDITKEIQNHPKAKQIEFVARKIRVDFQLFRSLFSPSTDQIVKHIKDLVKKPAICDTKVFYLVDDFSRSDIVYNAVKSAFPNANVIWPRESGLAVLKGAVIFGHSPVAVSSRIAKYSYGVNISPPFEEGIHPNSRLVNISGSPRCKDVFKKYIEKGTTLTYGMQVPGKHVAVKEFQSDMLLKVFVSKSKNPKFCDEPESEFVGNLVVKLPRQKSRVVVEVKFIVGETELKVEAEEQTTNKVFEAYFDFL